MNKEEAARAIMQQASLEIFFLEDSSLCGRCLTSSMG